MRPHSLLMIAAAVLLLLATGGPTSLAEGDSGMTRDPTLQRGRGLFNFLSRPAGAPRPQRQQAAPAPQQRRAPAVVRDDPVIPKVEIVHHIVVFGDSLATLVADGLADALNDRPDVAVTTRTKSDSGLVRSDFYDWPKVASAFLAGDEKITVAVMMLGLNDRQALREGDAVHEPLSERWLAVYKARIEAVTAAFAARRIPLIWVGLPPTQNGRISDDMLSFNDIYRPLVERAGGHYVDLWGAYVDAENRYTALGPDVTGQTARLRTGDGIHFTKAGARKAAHFVDVVVRRLIGDQPQGADVIALPAAAAPGTAGLQPGDVERLIDQMVSGLPEITGLSPSLRVKPVAGPILPLTGMPHAGEAALIATVKDARGQGDAAVALDRVYGQGIAPEARPGRIDDHRWPRPD